MRLSKGVTTNWTSTFSTNAVDPSPPTKEEFQGLCIALDIKNAMQAAELLGSSWRTCQRYWYGEVHIPGPVIRLLRGWASQKLTHDEIRKQVTGPKITRRRAESAL